jgi:pimeloyl-ACP methyl ester carboxylesterase
MSTAEFIKAQTQILERFGVEATSRFINVPLLAGKAHVLVSGDGPPVMMVIGGGMVAAMWAPLMAQLKGFTLYAVDLPGNGLSDPTTYRTATLRTTGVGFLEQAQEGLGLEQSPFIAQSMGGLWSTWLALDRPGRVSAISYIGCPALILGTSAPFLLRFSTLSWVTALLERLDPPSLKRVDRVAAMAGEDLRTMPELRRLFLESSKLPASGSQLLSLHRAAVRIRGAQPAVALTPSQLQRLTQPVQLIWGENDSFGPPSVGRQAADMIPDAEIHVVGGGHGPWFSQHEMVGWLLTRFLDANTRDMPVEKIEPGSGSDRPEPRIRHED